VRARVTVDGVIAVIDAPAVAAGRFADDPTAVQAERASDPAVAHEQPLKELFDDQLACADMIILNKADCLDTRVLGEVGAEIEARLRPETKVVPAVRGVLDPRVVLGIGGAVETIDARWSHHDDEEGEHGHDEFVSFVAELGPIADLLALERRIRAVTAEHDVLRVKGFLHVSGKGMRHVVQCVGTRLERYFDRPWRPEESPCSRLVVIGQKGIDAAAIRVALQG
jgi:cobalamin biosynthesis protein CobW